MALYVVRVPAPEPGMDWQTVVPGQYLWNVTGITAELTSSIPPSNVARDSSGNGYDGTYFASASPTGFPFFTAGLVPGDLGLLAIDNPTPISTTVIVQAPLFDTTIGFSVVWWQLNEPAQANATPYGWGATDNPVTFALLAMFDFLNTGRFIFKAGTPGDWRTAPGAITADGLAHFYAITFDAGTGDVTFYIDGAVVPWDDVGFFNSQGPIFDIALGVNTSGDQYDEWATFDYELGAGDVLNMYNGGLISFDDWVPEVVGRFPTGFWHLDDAAVESSRQVDLVVTDGTDTVLEVPTGFAPPTPPGPFQYSWQPTLRTSTQTPGGATIAVAIPRLVLPAGYTIGTRTLDISATDQWVDVSIWWDSNVQDSLRPLDPYAYPPGAYLVYQGPRNRP